MLQSDNESIITAKNESVVAKVTSQDIKKISYCDYGQTNDIKSGNGYNGEMLDESGLIYLRARYYDPSVSRFVQIDNNYSGEKEQVVSQNKYVYTLSNPYKYVDKDGNKATTCPPVGVGTASGVASALNYLTMSDKDFKKWLAKKPIWERPTYITNRIVFQAVKKITGLATGPKTSLINATRKTVASQIKNATRGFGLFMILIDIGKDFITNFIDFMFGLISAAKAFANSIGSVVYNALRVVGSTILRTVLMPFFGPFAWLITLIVDVGIDVIGWFVNLKAEVTKFVEWIAGETWPMVISFGKAIKKII